MGGLGGWLSPALTAGTNLVGAYQGAQADASDRRQKELALRIQQQRQQHNDEITNALKAAQTGALTAPVAKPKRSTATFKVNGKATLGSMDESGTYYDAAGNEVRDGVEPFEKPDAQGHVVDPVTGEVKFFDPKAPPKGLRVNPAPKEPAIVPGVGPDGQPKIFRVPKAGGAATEVEGITPKETGGRSSAAMKKAIAANQTQLSVIQDALNELDAHPDAVGIKRGVGDLPFMGKIGDMVNQRADPSGVAARASLANIGSMVIHDRSGAAVTVSEFPRLAPFVPGVSDTPEAIRTKLKKLAQAIGVETSALGATPTAATNAPHAANDPGGNVDLGAKPPLAQRAMQLKQQGLSKEAARAQLAQEGYDLNGND